MCLVSIETKTRTRLEIDKLNNGNYCITVDGRMIKTDLSADEVIRWLASEMTH